MSLFSSNNGSWAQQPTAPAGKYSSLPPVIPDDPEMMTFVDLDNIQIGKDELARQKLTGKRREFLKTDLTWRQVLLENDPKHRFEGQVVMLIGIAKSLGYEYFCSNCLDDPYDGQSKTRRVFKIIENPKKAEPSQPDWIWEETGLAEDDINEVL
jgi:hypothetical protein